MWALIVAGQTMMTFSSAMDCAAYLQAAGLGYNPGAGCVQIMQQPQDNPNDPCAGLTGASALNCRTVNRGITGR